MRSGTRASIGPSSSVRRRVGIHARQGTVAVLASLFLIAGQGWQVATAGVREQSSTSRVVTIITGQRVRVDTTADGVATVSVLPSSQLHPRVPVSVIRQGGDDYVIPASAQPYLSRYLDLNLFDVTRLAAAGITGRIPLRITYKRGTTPKVPGVTITSASNGVAKGFVTTDSAQRFGKALAAQAYADQRAGWPASSPLFGSVTGIAADVAPTPTVTPDFAMVTLIIKVFTRRGDPVPFGFGLLINQDDGRKFGQFILVVKGEARVSVPLGHYMGIFDDLGFTSDGGATFRVMPVSEYPVTQADQTLTVDAATATAAPSLSTPLPSVNEELDLSVNGQDERGFSGFSFGYGIGPGSRILLEPTPVPTIGSLDENTRWIRVDPSTPGGTYLYDATFVDPGVPADQAHTMPDPGGTAQIDESYLADRLNGLGATLRLIFVPHQFFAFAIGIPLPLPTARVEYVVAPKGSALDDVVLQNIQSFWDPGWFEDPFEKAVAGSVRSATWLRNPYSMGVLEPTPVSKHPACWACRSSGRMTFVKFPQDGDPTHQGFPFGSPSGKPVARFRVYRNGALIFDKNDRLGAIFKVPSTAGTYRVVNDLDRRLTESNLSTRLRSSVTFRSAAGEGAPMPSGWFCFVGSSCTVLPVLTEGIDLHATPIGTLPLGPTMFDLTVGHIAGAEDPVITSVSVSIRRSGRPRWTALPVTLDGAGQYQVAFHGHPRMDGKTFDLRVTATDAQGGALADTTTRAFQVSA